MFSYWERETFWKRPDVVIIGSGIVGLNAAIHLKSIAPTMDVRVIERGFLPYGASTRNAGFACFGSMTELLADLRKSPMEEVIGLVQKRWRGLCELRELLGDETIGYEQLGGYEIFNPQEEPVFSEAMEKSQLFNGLLEDAIGIPRVFSDASSRIRNFALGNVNHMIWNSAEGQVDTGRMMDALMRLATSMGIRIHTGINVTRIEEDENGIELMTAEEFRMSCRHLLLATNGFTGKLVNGLDVAPARAQVLMTKPIDGLQVKGCFHYQEGYYYFRNVGDRILLGGARNTDLKTEYTDQMKLTDKIQDHLEGFLATYVLPGKKYEIDLRWSGIMGLGQDKSPILKRLTERSWCAVRMGGMGVAIGTTAGKDLARLFMKDHG